MRQQVELFEEVYYSPIRNKIYVCLVCGSRIVRVTKGYSVPNCELVVQWTPKFEAEFSRCVLLGEL